MNSEFGRYSVHLEESGLVLTHPTKISFDMTLDEAYKLLEILKCNEQLLSSSQTSQSSCSSGKEKQG